jgi:predicted hotdog family 3-hydroxylacyl-ACP dehydratase
MPLNGASRMDRAWIEAHIPHHGSMCLLDEVISWDARHLRCRSSTHRDAAHPLKLHARLGIACGIEYAVQAMAVHGAIAAQARAGGGCAKAEAGFLAGLRDVRMHAERLDDIDADLVCEVQRIAGDASTALYSFELSADRRRLLEGRATVVLDASGRLTGQLTP